MWTLTGQLDFGDVESWSAACQWLVEHAGDDLLSLRTIQRELEIHFTVRYGAFGAAASARAAIIARYSGVVDLAFEAQ